MRFWKENKPEVENEGNWKKGIFGVTLLDEALLGFQTSLIVND